VVHIRRKPVAARLRARPGLQQRSRDSFEAVLAAAESLLNERLFEDVGMAEIARRARLAVGTVYQRFPSKEALVPSLFDRHNAVAGRRVASLLDDLAREPDLRARIDLLVTFAVDYHVRHRGLLRALTVFVRANPAVASEALFRERQGIYEKVAARLVGAEDDSAPADRLEAALFALGIVNSVCREQILFGDVSPLARKRGQAAELRRRLPHVVACILASTPSRTSGTRP
jgi:AcrR family transcriptional regulator